MLTPYTSQRSRTFLNISGLGAAVLFLTLTTAAQVTNPSACGLNLPIPDSGCSSSNSLTVPIAVSGFNNQLGVNASLLSVDLIITHTWRDDLRVYLTAPGGTERALMLERGGSGENYGNTSNCPTAVLRFQDGGTALTSMGSADNITGVYAPEFAFANYTGNPNGTWQLRICDSAGDDVGALQYVAIGISNQIVGVEERTALNSMRLFPNPVVDQLTVSMATLEAGALQFQVFDGTGREVLTGSRQLHAGDVVFNVDLTALPTGNYNTRFILNNTVSTQRFTKLQ